MRVVDIKAVKDELLHILKIANGKRVPEDIQYKIDEAIRSSIGRLEAMSHEEIIRRDPIDYEV